MSATKAALIGGVGAWFMVGLGAPKVCMATGPCPTSSVTTAADYANLVHCVLDMIHDSEWADLATTDQAALTGYSAVFQTANDTLLAVFIDELLPVMSSQDIADFEAIVHRSQILPEVEALQTLVFDTSASQDAKKTAKAQAENSVKEILKRLAEKAPWGLGDLIKGLIDVVNEILAVIRGGKQK